MQRRPWYEEPLPLPPLEEKVHRVRGLVIPDAFLSSPEGEPWPDDELFQRRLAILLNEYAHLCEMAKVVFPIANGYQLTGIGHPLHTAGWSLDLYPAGGWTIAHMGSLVRERWRMPGSRLCGMGMYPGWLHFDVRPRQRFHRFPRLPNRSRKLYIRRHYGHPEDHR